MGGMYQEFLLALHDMRIRRMFALAVAAAICLAGWAGVWFVPNRYQAEARIFVQVDNLLPDKIGVSIASRQRQISQLKRTLTSTVTIERLIRDPDVAVFMSKDQRPIDVIIDLRRTIEVVEQQENLFRISARIGFRHLSDKQNAQLARLIVQKLIDIFVADNVQGGRIETDTTLRFLDQQIVDLQAKMRAANTRRAQYELGMFGRMSGSGTVEQQVAEARRELVDVESDLLAAQMALLSFADASALAMLPLAAAASQTLRVALTGDGADELLAGYRRHRFHMVEERVREAIPAALRSCFFGALGALYPKADFAPLWLRGRATLQSLATHGAMAYARAVSMLVPEERKRLFTPSFLAALQGYRAEDRYISVIDNAPAQTMLDRIQYADLKISLPGGILTKVDRTTMAHGLEVRSPFLDTEMIGLATQLPDALRLQAGQGKWILKTATQAILPQHVRQRPKLGFVPPLRGWFRGPLADIAIGLSHARCVQETGWFNATWIEDIACAHITGKADWSRALWQLWIFSLWFDQHLGLDSAHRQNTGHLVAH